MGVCTRPIESMYGCVILNVCACCMIYVFDRAWKKHECVIGCSVDGVGVCWRVLGCVAEAVLVNIYIYKYIYIYIYIYIYVYI